MVDLLSIIGVFLAIEGAFYAGVPTTARKLAYDVSQMDDTVLRRAGLVALVAGVALVWLVRG